MPSVQVPVVTIAPTALLPGVLGPVESGILDPAATKFVVVTTPTALLWPASGEVLRLTVEESQNGSPFRFSASNPLSGGVWRNRDGSIMASDTWTTDFMFVGANRRIRLTLQVFQACTVGAVASTQ